MRRLVLFLVVGTAACTSPPPLTHAADSPEALGRAVVERLAARDIEGLRQLMLTRDEFKAYVWPHLPASRPETNMPMWFVWNRLQQQSQGHLAQVVARHGGQPMTFVSIATTGESSEYGSVWVDRESTMTVRTAAGDVEEVTLFGSIVRQGSRYKIFSFVTD